MIAAAALPVLMGSVLGACELPPECDGTQEEVSRGDWGGNRNKLVAWLIVIVVSRGW